MFKTKSMSTLQATPSPEGGPDCPGKSPLFSLCSEPARKPTGQQVVKLPRYSDFLGHLPAGYLPSSPRLCGETEAGMLGTGHLSSCARTEMTAPFLRPGHSVSRQKAEASVTRSRHTCPCEGLPRELPGTHATLAVFQDGLSPAQGADTLVSTFIGIYRHRGAALTTLQGSPSEISPGTGSAPSFLSGPPGIRTWSPQRFSVLPSLWLPFLFPDLCSPKKV